MSDKKALTAGIISLISGFVIAGGIAFYIFTMMNQELEGYATNYALTSSDIVTEFLEDNTSANIKYLASGDQSVVIEVTGEVQEIKDNLFGNKVVLLKGHNDLAGVSASFTKETNDNVNDLLLGQTVVVKGVIKSGVSYDEKLGVYDNIILEESDLVSK